MFLFIQAALRHLFLLTLALFQQEVQLHLRSSPLIKALTEPVIAPTAPPTLAPDAIMPRLEAD